MAEECFHGGAFWEGIGADFRSLEKRHSIVAADVLDAWFPPAPKVIRALAESLDWICRTSPPTHSEGVIDAIAQARHLRPDTLLAGPGSSALLYAALGHWLTPGSRVALIEPSYGEYAHFCSQAIPCEIQFVTTESSRGFRLDLDHWVETIIRQQAVLAVLVRPNNPTGVGVSLEGLGSALQRIPSTCRVLIDEAYIDYTSEASAEGLLAKFPNVFVLKSLSKCFALSGLRVAYLAGEPSEIGAIAKNTPPWWISLPAQIAAVHALDSLEYYVSRYAETALLREELTAELNLECLGAANWLLLKLPSPMRSDQVVARARHQGVYLRDAGQSAPSLDHNWIRIAIKSPHENQIISQVLNGAIFNIDPSAVALPRV